MSQMKEGEKLTERMFFDLAAKEGLKVDKTEWNDQLAGDFDTRSISFVINMGEKQVSESFPKTYLEDKSEGLIEPKVHALVQRLKSLV